MEKRKNEVLHHTVTIMFVSLFTYHSIINCKAERVILEKSGRVPQNASCAPQYDSMLRGKCSSSAIYNSELLIFI